MRLVATLPLAGAFLLKARHLHLERTLRGGTARSGRRLPLPPGRVVLVAVQAALVCAVICGGTLRN